MVISMYIYLLLPNLRATGYSPHEVMFEHKNSLFLMDIEDFLEGNIYWLPFSMLRGEKTKMASHEEFVKKIKKI